MSVSNLPSSSTSQSHHAAEREESRFRLRWAAVLALGCTCFYLGFVWDVQWHADVGPETFFTAPHLLMYAGPMLCGLVSLFMLARTTLKYRNGAPGVSDTNTTPWLGLLRAPVGFILAGFGALGFILAGLYDLWWHTLYGFDVTLLSPPHFGLLFGGMVAAIGSLYAFASEANRALTQGDDRLMHPARIGLVYIVVILLAGMTGFLFIGSNNVRVAGGLIGYAVMAAIMVPLGLMIGVSFFRKPGIATLIALVYTGVRVAMLGWGPWASGLQGQVQELPMRWNAVGLPVIALSMPAWLVLMGLAVDLSLWLYVRQAWRRPWVVFVGGAVGLMGALTLDQPWAWLIRHRASYTAQQRIMADFTEALPLTLVVGAGVAVLFGWVGWRLGVYLRYTVK